jgi:hypothetical protein
MHNIRSLSRSDRSWLRKDIIVFHRVGRQAGSGDFSIIPIYLATNEE